jgi:hypothetical protein
MRGVARGRWSMMHSYMHMYMRVPNVGVSTHEQGHEKEAKAQQKAKNEDQGKRIGSDQSIPSFRGNTCLASARHISELTTHRRTIISEIKRCHTPFFIE